jgi:hypothetical protein
VQYVDPRIQVGNLTLAVHLNGVTELFVVDDTVVVRVLFEKSIEKLRFVIRQVASVVVDQSRYEVLGDVEFETFHSDLVEVTGWHSSPTERLNPYGVELVKVNLQEFGFAELKVDQVFDLLQDLRPKVDGQRLKVVALEGVNANAVNGGVDEVLNLRGIDVHHR